MARARSGRGRGGGRSRRGIWPASIRRVSPDELRWECDPDLLARAVKSEARAAAAEAKALEKEIPDARARAKLRLRARLGARPAVALAEVVGQERALEALCSALSTEAPGFHAFVCGQPGSGREALVRAALAKQLPPFPRPKDRVYVANFRHPNRPRLLTLPRGKGRRFVRALDDVLAALRRAIPAALNNEQHVSKVERLRRRTENAADRLIEDLAAELRGEGLIVGAVPEGYATPELKVEVEEGLDPLSARVVQRKLAAGELRSTRKLKRRLRRYDPAREELEAAAGEARAQVRKGALALRRLEARVARGVAQGFTDDLARAFPTKPVRRWLDLLLEAIGVRVELFLEQAAREEEREEEIPRRSFLEALNVFRANLFVDAKELPVPPVLFEPNPTYQNLFGSLDATDGLPDPMRLRAGSLLRANGGVIVVDAAQLFHDQAAWGALKRAVKSGWMEVQRAAGSQGNSLRPEPIRTAFKVICIGTDDLYDHMHLSDSEFPSVFKIKAQLEGPLVRTRKTVHEMGQALSRISRRAGLRTPDAPALARLIEHSARLSDRNDRLEPAFSRLLDILQEADRIAAASSRPNNGLRVRDVEAALEAIRRRHDLDERQAQESIDDDTVLLEVDGRRVGVINALVVYDEGVRVFSRPTRVTANVGMGREGLLDIEGEASFSGESHTKGVAIVGAILRERYAQDKPLCLTATLCFEQNYTVIDGDSASLAEMLVVLSALGELPLDQGWGVTGSINQKGEIQAIGEVSAKIEGFFDTCASRGLTGRQGVVFPEGNLRDLMLRGDVVKAVSQGRFHVASARTLDDVFELLTGVTPGSRRTPFDPYPEGSANARVDARLMAYAQAARRFSGGVGG